IYLEDIAKVKSKYKSVDVITQVNGERNIVIGISKNDKSNAIELVKQIKHKIKELKSSFPELSIDTSFDSSIYINKRLNTVVSGILFGLILVALCIYILINKRVAFIVVLGIPTAILFGTALLYLSNYSINMMSLIGILLVLGILVDDAVIIAENIQRHIVLGENKLEATIKGTNEVLRPVLAASFTTIFAFFPMMMLSGELGEFLKIIPTAIVVLIMASILESFIFLPLHSLHILKKDDKELDWSKAQNFYSKILHKIIHHRIKFLVVFTCFIPLLSYVTFERIKYQMMPEVDTNLIFIKGEFDQSYSVKQTFEKAQELENILLQHKEDLSINTLSFLSGLSFDSRGNMQMKPSIFQFNIELYEKKHDDFVNATLMPLLSLNAQELSNSRGRGVDETIEEIQTLISSFKPHTLQELTVKKESSGITENDIEILLSSKDKVQLNAAIKEIKNKLQEHKGIVFVQDSRTKGIKELKLKINSYGESLGFTENSLAVILNALFLKSELTKGVNSNGLFEVLSFDENKDNLDTLYNLEISIPNSNQQIALNEICDFIYVKNSDSISKTNQNIYEMIFANVNNAQATSQEVLQSLEKSFDKYRHKGVLISLEGEEEQNEKMFEEMSFAIFISISLIFITLLLMFNSFSQSFMILSIIPFSLLGALLGHLFMSLNFSLPSIIGITGLSGVVINDAIVMLDFIRKSKSLEEMMQQATLRLRPIIITSITTFLGLSTLIFYASGQAKILQPIAISLGFGLLWGTVLTLLYLPALFAVTNKFKKES
ncbi:MAG: efflux RND transporter permease subunit, partial [Campylobacteraceae bacterium]|nr:efflux RND transporter permease subunit [Campylobacteraceae bacterium]